MHKRKALLIALACLAGCDFIKHRPYPLGRTATVELHTVSASPTPGAKTVVDPDTGDPLYLTLPAIISAADVAEIQRSDDPPEMPSLIIHLTPGGARKLFAATSKTAGTRMALVVNGKVVAAPKVMSPLSSSFHISGGEVSDRREEIFAALTDP